jgi:hypothetical protein
MGQATEDVFEAELSVIGAARQVAASASGGSESSGYLLMTQTSLLDAIAPRVLLTSKVCWYLILHQMDYIFMRVMINF